MILEKAVIVVEKTMGDTAKAQEAYSKAKKYSKQETSSTINAAQLAYDALQGSLSSASSTTKTKTFVQFNPSTLSISNQAKSMEQQNSQSGEVTSNESNKNAMTLNVTLSYYKKDDVSVRDNLEGFMGLILLPETPRITFLWGAMFFTGELKSVSPKYIYFDAKGEPTFGTVSLTIESDNSEKISAEYWKNQLKKYE